MNIFLCKSFLFIGNIIIKKRNFELLRTFQHFLMSVLKPCEVNRKKESNDNIFRYFPKYLVKRVFLFPFFFCVSKCWYSCYFTSTRAFLHPRFMKICSCELVCVFVVKFERFIWCSSLWCMRGISRSQTHLSLQQRRQEERRAETTENSFQ